MAGRKKKRLVVVPDSEVVGSGAVLGSTVLGAEVELAEASRRVGGEASGLAAMGGGDRPAGGVSEHGGGCGCRRCVPMSHGASAVVSLAEEAEVLALELAEVSPVDVGEYRHAFDLAGLALARKAQFLRYIGELEEAFEAGEIDRGEKLAREAEATKAVNGVIRTGLAALQSLGQTPKARAELLRDAGIGRAAGLRADAAGRLRAHVEGKRQGEIESGG